MDQRFLSIPGLPGTLPGSAGRWDMMKNNRNEESPVIIRNSRPLRVTTLLVLLLASGLLKAQEEAGVDYLTFARGAIPVSVSGDGAALKTSYEHALKAIDGSGAPFVMTPKPGGPDTSTEFVFELPALTTFTHFTVPNVGETPSPSQTFVSRVELSGSAEGPEGPFMQLAASELITHDERGQITELVAAQETPVRWLRMVLSGGIDVQRDRTFFEFSEISGYGSQERVPLSEAFSGKWKGRGVLMELRQDGAMVTGCYDRTGDLTGAVTGSMLYASGEDRNDGTFSAFVLTVTPEGGINGVRSSNGAPFRIYAGDPAPGGTVIGCSEPAGTGLGCGAVVYGIQFDFDSADIRPESGQVLDELFKGLENAPGASIVIEGHTSSEGSDAYNQQLSERRAQAVVEALVSRGLEAGRVTAAGKGESEPVADNDEEAGRTLNRRVEVECSS